MAEAEVPPTAHGASRGERDGKLARTPGWWRSRTRAQLQVEFACLAARSAPEGFHGYPRAACFVCNGTATQHGVECELGDAMTNDKIALAIGGYDE